MNRRAFTLIELLVVMAIVAVLLGMMLPMLAKGREAARQVTCLSNLHQIGVQTAAYADDNGGVMPDVAPCWFEAGNSTNVILKNQQANAKTGFDHYLPDILLCPTDENPAELWVRQRDGTADRVPVSYASNFDLVMKAANIAAGKFAPVRLDLIRRPSSVALFWDGSMGEASGVIHGTEHWIEKTARPRHNNRVNAVFADAHAATFDEISNDMLSDNGTIWHNPPGHSGGENPGGPPSGGPPGGGPPGGGPPGRRN